MIYNSSSKRWKLNFPAAFANIFLFIPGCELKISRMRPIYANANTKIDLQPN